jgi:hypothetical protein
LFLTFFCSLFLFSLCINGKPERGKPVAVVTTYERGWCGDRRLYILFFLFLFPCPPAFRFLGFFFFSFSFAIRPYVLYASVRVFPWDIFFHLQVLFGVLSFGGGVFYKFFFFYSATCVFIPLFCCMYVGGLFIFFAFLFHAGWMMMGHEAVRICT